MTLTIRDPALVVAASPAGVDVPDNLILLWDGSGSLPSGWSAYAPSSPGSYLAAGAAHGTGGGATQTLDASAGHSDHTDAHVHALSVQHDAYNEAINEGDMGAAVAADHVHGAGNSEAAQNGSVTAATTRITANNAPPHVELRPYINSGGARSFANLLALTDVGAPTGWSDVSATHAGRFVKLVDAAPGGTGGAAAPSYAVTDHHATHGAYSHDHGPATPPQNLTVDSVDPTDTAVNTGSSANARGTPTSHSHTASVSATSTATPNLSSTTISAQSPPNFVDALDAFVVRLLRGAADSIAAADVVGLWDEANGAVPVGWSEISVTATNNQPLVRIESAGGLGEVARTQNPLSFDVTHQHAVDSHGHTTTATVDNDAGSASDAGADTRDVSDYTGGEVLAAAATATLSKTESTWTVQAGSTTPAFERFKLIRKD